MSTVHLSHGQAVQSNEGQAHHDSPLTHHQDPPPSRGSPHCECEHPSASEQVGTMCRLCESPLREHQRNGHDNHAGRNVHQASGTGQLYEEPLPFELIPFDSGQLLTLRAIELQDIADFVMAVDSLLTAMQAGELDGDAYTVEYF